LNFSFRKLLVFVAAHQALPAWPGEVLIRIPHPTILKVADKPAAWCACSNAMCHSPHAHYLCWRTGAMDRREVAAFAGWLKKAVI
jgi:hypothetical protein